MSAFGEDRCELTVAPSDPAAYAATAARCVAALEATVPAGDLRLMNTETAMDLGMLAGALAAPGASLGIFGISFGTYVAHRYLHLFPEQPTAVVLDSMVPPEAFAVSLVERLGQGIAPRSRAPASALRASCRSPGRPCSPPRIEASCQRSIFAPTGASPRTSLHS